MLTPAADLDNPLAMRHAGRDLLSLALIDARNRTLRLLAAFDIAVLRLVRVAIGALALGELAKGQWRVLSGAEVAALKQSAS